MTDERTSPEPEWKSKPPPRAPDFDAEWKSKPPPAWEPDRSGQSTPVPPRPSGPPISDDGRFWWDGARWQPLASTAPQAAAPSGGGTSVGKVALGVALGLVLVLVVGWFVVSFATSDDDADCAADRVSQSYEDDPTAVPESCR